jgi:hypothetical protein
MPAAYKSLNDSGAAEVELVDISFATTVKHDAAAADKPATGCLKQAHEASEKYVSLRSRVSGKQTSCKHFICCTALLRASWHSDGLPDLSAVVLLVQFHTKQRRYTMLHGCIERGS